MVARTALTLLFALSASAHLHHPHRDAARHFVERQDPHAIPPLAQISQGMPTEPAVPLTATPVAVPNMSGYPVVPYGQRIPTDSPEVKQWLAEVAASGIQIPGLKPNAILPDDAPRGMTLCTLNPDASAASGADKNCWWSCGLCTRTTDVVTCPDKLAWGLTFDDGPSPYTPKLLNYLADKNLKASFYVIGANIVNHPEILQATYLAGHELTLGKLFHGQSGRRLTEIHRTHPQMTTLTNEQIVAELGWTRKAIQAVLGVTPRYFRPPYGDCDDRVRAIAKAMGLTPVIWTDGFDTDDWSVNSGTLSTDLFNGYTKMLDAFPNQPAGVISLQHDWYQGTVDLAVGYFLPAALSHNPAPAFQPVIQCQHQPMGASYVETSGGSVPPANNNATTPAATVTPSATASASHATGPAGGSGSKIGSSTSASASPSTTGSANSASAVGVGAGTSMVVGAFISVWALI